jgi:pyruvate ferredoxin oxidoreductase alpha subunit
MSLPQAAYGHAYPHSVDLSALRQAHKPRYPERTEEYVDGNTAAAIPFLQWWRAPIMVGFPITPSTKWLEHMAAEVGKGHYQFERDGRRVHSKRVKLLEAEHAVADYLVGAAATCRDLIVGTATSSVGLDHMAETLRSLGGSGLGNVVVVNVCRSTANFPLCIEGDTSDHLAHRDSGFVQYMNRGRQQIYDSLLQLPAVGMHSLVQTPVMPAYVGIKDSHRSSRIIIESDDAVNAFLDEALALGAGPEGRNAPPGLLEGDTSMGNCVTSAYFQGFKHAQKKRLQHALEVLPKVAALFERHFGRPGLQLFEEHHMEDAEIALVCMGADAGTLLQSVGRLRSELGVRVGVIVLRLLTPFPAEALARALRNVRAVGVVNSAHHHGRGHLTLDVEDALREAERVPVESFFCGLGGADVSPETWKLMARITAEAAHRQKTSKRWHLVHEGVELEEAN